MHCFKSIVTHHNYIGNYSSIGNSWDQSQSYLMDDVMSCVERKARKNCMKSDENDENLAHIVIFRVRYIYFLNILKAFAMCVSVTLTQIGCDKADTR